MQACPLFNRLYPYPELVSKTMDASPDFSYQKDIQLEAYEWVLLECMRGDQMLFVREDGVELTWALLKQLY